MKFLLVFSIQICAISTTAAEVYKCQHSDRATMYSDRPCMHAPSVILPIKSLATSPASKKQGKQIRMDYLTKQEKIILLKLNRREKYAAKIKNRNEKRRTLQKSKQAAQKLRDLKSLQKKCRNYKIRLDKYEHKARSGYKASESNKLYYNIRQHKKLVTMYCNDR